MDLGPGKLSIDGGEEIPVLKAHFEESHARLRSSLIDFARAVDIKLTDIQVKFADSARILKLFEDSTKRAARMIRDHIAATAVDRIFAILDSGGIFFADVRGNTQVILGPDREALQLHGRRLRNFRRTIRRTRQLREAIQAQDYARADDLTRRLHGSGLVNSYIQGHTPDTITIEDCRDVIDRSRASLPDHPYADA